MVEEDHNKDSTPSSQKLTRRSFASVVGLSVFGTPGVLKSTTPTTVTIPFLLSGDEVVKEKEVPKDWKDHVEHATKANRQAQENLLSESSVQNVGLVGSEKTYGGKPGLKIRVEQEPTLTPNSRPIPQQQDGIEIEVTDAPSRGTGTGSTASECIVNDDAMNGIPGGVQVQATLNGTSTCKV